MSCTNFKPQTYTIDNVRVIKMNVPELGQIALMGELGLI